MKIVIRAGGDQRPKGPPTRLSVHWKPLTDAAQDAPSDGGLYFMGAPFTIRYGATISRIFYVGSSSNLRGRLCAHCKVEGRGNYLLQIFANSMPSNILCSYHPIDGLKAADLLSLESETLFTFGRQHGLIPHGNRIPPDDDGMFNWTGQVQIIDADVGGETLNEDEIAMRYDLTVCRDPFHVYPLPTLDIFSTEPNHEIKVYSINFMVKPKPRTTRKPRLRAKAKPALEKPLDCAIRIPKSETERNLIGRELERAGLVENAIQFYSANLDSEFEGNFPYERLVTIYRKRKQFDKVIAVLKKAVFVFENKVDPRRSDREPKLARFRALLAEAIQQNENTMP